MEITTQIFQDLMLSRSKQFIDRFKSLNNPKLDCEVCHCETNAYFLCAYSVKILLDDDTWNPEFKPIIAHFRKENDVIWNFLIENNMIPNDYESKFIDYAKAFASESIDCSYEEVFFAPLETLINNGAKQLDLDLYRASASLEFEETKRILALGANPDADIYISEGHDDEFPETWSSLGLTGGLWDDVYTCIELHHIWKEEFEIGVKYTLPDSVFCQMITSAAYKMMCDLLDKQKPKIAAPTASKF